MRPLRPPTVVGVTAVRNEGDIVGQVLRHAAARHDLILVVDAASTDDTRAEVEAVERDHPHVVLLGTLPRPSWAEPIRRWVWWRFRSSAPAGTWWSWVDGDELTDEDLPTCVRAAEREGADHIAGNSAVFFYRQCDARAWREGLEGLADRARPIGERRRHYRMDVYSMRLFREMGRLRWPQGDPEPLGLVRPWSRRIDYRHYQYRDLAQIEERLRTRRDIELPEAFTRQHYHWRYEVEQALAPDDDPTLREWTGGPLVPAPTLPPLWVPPAPIRAWRRARAWWRGRAGPDTPPPELLPHGDVQGVWERRRRGTEAPD